MSPEWNGRQPTCHSPTDASERFLPWLIAFMVYLAGLALACAIVVHQLVARWDTGLSGQLTVEVPLIDPEASAHERQAEVDRVLAVLNGTPGVTGAMHYQPEEIAELLEPWLGSGIADQSLPLPAMIAVTIDPAQPPDLAALGQALQRAVPGTLLDDHQRWPRQPARPGALDPADRRGGRRAGRRRRGSGGRVRRPRRPGDARSGDRAPAPDGRARCLYCPAVPAPRA